MKSPDWSKDFRLKKGHHRKNIYELSSETFFRTVKRGQVHALYYPVEVTGLYIPYRPLEAFLDSKPSDPLRWMLATLLKKSFKKDSVEDVYEWLGLHPYPRQKQKGIYAFPNPYKEKRLAHTFSTHHEPYMGATLRKTRLGDALTFSCAACHSANLFGKKILGMTNRTSRANEFIHLGRKATSFSSPKFFQDSTKATDLETLQYERTRENAYSIGSKAPQAIGLDTSLAQVALSLSKRKKDPYASHSWFRATFPRKNALRNKVADSKPAVWWNLKYKTRWLSDGSIVSGNPVHTNFLWNEIGRGTDLKELEAWLQKNHRAVKELTATVFATEAPRYSDFFEVHQEDLESAKKGQKHYRKLCSSCHGVYRKAWELDQPEEFSVAELMNTIEVIYHEKTPVIDVGTDPGRYQGMKAFAERLNKLKISKAIKTRVEPQTGYVPPPLVGIWARWPYFHNNSIPNLCVLLSPAPKRPAHYWSHPANDSERDFDKDCNGYFTGEEVPDSWKKRSRYFDTQKEGLSNRGHDEGIFIEDGKSLLSETEKKELIDYLKTL